MNKQEALDTILEFYDAPQEELEHVYDLTMHLYHKTTRENLIKSLIEHYKRRINVNQAMLNVCKNKPDMYIEKQRINQGNRILLEQISKLECIVNYKKE